jgi:hypothetical protein
MPTTTAGARDPDASHETVRSPLADDLYHLGMAAFYTARLALRQKDVWNTYHYCHHLEQVSFVDRAWRRHADANPHLMSRLGDWLMFADAEPDAAALEACPEGSLGREYAKICRQYRTGELDYLRPLRLRTLPHEAVGLDLAHGQRLPPGRSRDAWLLARRNIFMTTSHDLAHLVAGCDVSLEGEALVAMYQYHHLRVPQNFMNMWNARLFLSATGRFGRIRRIRRAWRWVQRSINPLAADWTELWPLPLEVARERLSLPREGMQLAPLPAG